MKHYRLAIILVAALAGAAIGAVITSLTPKEYRSEITIAVKEAPFPMPEPKETKVLEGESLEAIISTLGLREAWKEKDPSSTDLRLRKGIRFQTIKDSLEGLSLVRISMVDTDAELAAKIANAAGWNYTLERYTLWRTANEVAEKRLQKEISELISLQESLHRAGTSDFDVEQKRAQAESRLFGISLDNRMPCGVKAAEIWEIADPAARPSSPDPAFNLLLGAITGMAASGIFLLIGWKIRSVSPHRNPST